MDERWQQEALLRAEIARLQAELLQLTEARAVASRPRRTRHLLEFAPFAVENLSDAAYVIAQDASIVYVNWAACEMLRYDEEELLALRIFDIKLESDARDLESGMGPDGAAQPSIIAILASGYTLDGEVQAILENGAKGSIQKPFRAVELSHQLSEVLGDRSTASQVTLRHRDSRVCPTPARRLLRCVLERFDRFFQESRDVARRCCLLVSAATSAPRG